MATDTLTAGRTSSDQGSGRCFHSPRPGPGSNPFGRTHDTLAVPMNEVISAIPRRAGSARGRPAEVRAGSHSGDRMRLPAGPGQARHPPDAGSAVVLGSSGDAVSALALAQAHPELVRTTSPCPRACPWGCSRPSLARSRPRPAPLVPARDARAHQPAARHLPPCAPGRPASWSASEPTRQANSAIARRPRSLRRSAREPTMFPGGHIGFADDPDGFVTRLRAVLYGN